MMRTILAYILAKNWLLTNPFTFKICRYVRTTLRMKGMKILKKKNLLSGRRKMFHVIARLWSDFDPKRTGWNIKIKKNTDLIFWGINEIFLVYFNPNLVIIDKDNKKRRVIGENSNLTYKFIRSGTFVLREFFKQYGFRECRELSNDFNIMWLNSHVKARFLFFILYIYNNYVTPKPETGWNSEQPVPGSIKPERLSSVESLGRIGPIWSVQWKITD